MAAAIKGVFLAIVLVAVFFPLDGVDGRCYFCTSVKGNPANCNAVKESETRKDPCGGQNRCFTVAKNTGGGVTRGCYLPSPALPIISPDACGPYLLGEEACVCEGDLCNSKGGAGYLHGSPLFVIGLIALTAVWNVGPQHLN